MYKYMFELFILLNHKVIVKCNSKKCTMSKIKGHDDD